MNKLLMASVLLFISIPLVSFSQKKTSLSSDKITALNVIDGHSTELIAMSDSIWKYAETALKEYKSSRLLADYVEQQGFKVERGVAGMPTAFVASYGSGRPIIGVLGEYDALPGLSQKVTPQQDALVPGAAGHGCGHNMFSPGSMGAAIAIKELMEQGKLKGTIRFYGTPAEEAIAGKIYMAREGLFNDLDVCFDWHPDYETRADIEGSQAMLDFNVTFHGTAAHAASDPWSGRSALDAVELFTHAVNMMREHVRPSVRMHYVISDGGDVPNVVPDHAAVWMWVRDSKMASVEELYARIKKMAEGAALMAGVTYEISLNSGDYEMLINLTGAKLLQKNLELLGPITYTSEETEFAKKIQIALGLEPTGMANRIQPLGTSPEDPANGSTDVADVSWVTPEISLIASTAPLNTPWHSWAVVACGGMSIGHKGMLLAAKAMAITMIDLYQKPELVVQIRNEFITKKGTRVFKAILPDGPPPVPEN